MLHNINMNNIINNIKYGKFSLVLKYDKISVNNLIKITYSNNQYHDDTQYNNIIKNINNYQKYYSLVDSVKYNIYKDSELFNFIKNIKINNNPHELITSELPLCYYIIPNDGEIDLLDNMKQLQNYYPNNIWLGKTILKFKLLMKQLCCGIYYLHSKQICHFDIKPDNILVNLGKYNDLKDFHLKFKIIDFGFAEKYPFPLYLKSGNGTPGYTTKFFGYRFFDNYVPDFKPNDWKTGKHESKFNASKECLPYKTDIFSLGVTFNLVLTILDEMTLINNICSCSTRKHKELSKIIELISCMTNPDIINRLNIKECIYKIKKFRLKLK